MKSNATLEIFKKKPELFLFQSGYLTFGNFESMLINPLKIANKEIELSLMESIFETLKIAPRFSFEEFELFLNQIKEFYSLSESENKETLDIRFNEIKRTLETFFANTIREIKEKIGEEIDDKTKEKYLTDVFYLFLNRFKWKNWTLSYQAEIFRTINEIKKPDFIFSNPKEEIEIIVEFMKSGWEEHISRKFEEKTKRNTKKIVVIYYFFKNFEKVERFDMKCYRKENEKVQLLLGKL